MLRKDKVTHYLENGWKHRLGYNEAPTGNDTSGIWWLRAQLRRVSQIYIYIYIYINIYLDANISKIITDKGSIPKDHQYEMAYGKSNGHVIEIEDGSLVQQCFF